MFQSRSEKGLFTFYWEQYQPQEERPYQPQQSLKQVEFGLEGNDSCVPKIEETKKINRKILKIKTKPFSQNVESPIPKKEIHKQNKPCKPLFHIDLSQSLVKEIQERSFKVVTNKEPHIRHQPKKSCQLPSLHRQDSQRQKVNLKSSRNKENQIFQKLLLGEHSLEPSRLNLKISQSKHIENRQQKKIVRQNGPKKTRKTDQTGLQRRQVTQRQKNSNLDCNCYFQPKEHTSYKFPMLGPSLRKTKNGKQPYLLQKIILDRDTIARCSSVVNLGIVSHDEYVMRFKTRKTQFLKVLTRNISGNLRT